MTDDPKADLQYERLAKILGNVLSLSANESVVMAQLEAFSFFSPMPASLPLGTGGPLEDRLDKLSEALGGPPRLIPVPEGKERPRFDTYATATIHESINAFMRARTSVCRTHLYLIGSALLKQNPEFMHLTDDPNLRRIVIDQAGQRFWEHAETSYVRLASFWDRLGQILDFTFFNVRQYERDGFPAVLDRIRSNFLPMSSSIRESPAWGRLWRFQNSEQNDGLKWLLRRRNLLVHSLHLGPRVWDDPENPIFLSAYNHLEETVRVRLRPGTPEEELTKLHSQLEAAASLFPDAVEVALIGTSLGRGA